MYVYTVFPEVFEEHIKDVSVTGIWRYTGQEFTIYFFNKVYYDIKPVKCT